MKNVVAYLLFLMLCVIVIVLTLNYGARTFPAGGPVLSPGPTEAGASALRENLRSPLVILLVQVVLIVLVARGLGAVARMLGQPGVIGEMIAGVLLGPSCLGWLSPGVMTSVFPDSSMNTLRIFSQVGVILFMFLVGTDIDLSHFRAKARTAVWVSHASIVLPFLIGTTLSFFIYRSMAPSGVPFTAFALFLGVAMSITAFPVLARIVEERGLTHSSLGTMSLGCAAVDDVTAWSILAIVLAIVKADGWGSALPTLLWVVVFAVVMIFLMKPLLQKLISARESKILKMKYEVEYNSWAAVILAFAFLCGLTTEIIGVHALFGAFLAGTIIPAGRLRNFCKARFETVASGLLLPLFFAFTGLRTRVDLLNDWFSWAICLVVIACAVVGKMGGSMLAARWSGMNWRDAFSLGALMNTRGLMELIVLNIGYDLGILSSRVFAILVLMALTTTFMTAPLLSLAQGKSAKNAFAAS